MSDDTNRPTDVESEDMMPGADAGISPEDRRDVAERIEAVVRENRIQVTPAMLTVASGRTGAAFPLLVNLLALVALAGGLTAGFLAFRRGEAGMAGAHGTFKTAEGRVIAELRRQADEQLQAKDGEIRSIQERLTGVRQERDQILAEIEDRVRQKEAELRKSLAAEMEAERRKLLATGQSREQVDARISDLQTRRNEEIAREIEGYRRQLDQEWERRLAGLKEVQSQYQQALAGLEQERLSISREAQAREQAMRREAAEQSKARQELTAKTDQAVREAAAARSALEALSEESRQEALVRSQVLGLYGRIADDVGAARYNEANAKLESLRGLYADPRFLSLPGVQERMKVDLFLADSLGRLIRQQQQEKQVDLPALATAAATLTVLESRAREAKAHAEAGRLDEAELRYREALESLPAAAEAHAFFLKRQDEGEARRLAAFRQRRAEADAALGRGALAAALGQYAAALAALAAGGVPAQEGEAAAAAVRSTADRLAQAAAQAARNAPAGPAGPVASAQAAEALRAADRLLAAREASRAFDAYLGVARSYPASAQLPEALAGADRAVQQMAADAQRQAAELRGSVAQMQGALAGQQAEVRRLAAFEAREKSLREKYESYAGEENRLVQAQGEGGLASAKLALDSFLTSEPASGLMPGFWNRTQRYQNAFERAGRQNAIGEAADIVYNLAGARDRAGKLAFLDGEARRYAGDEATLGLIEELRALVEE